MIYAIIQALVFSSTKMNPGLIYTPLALGPFICMLLQMCMLYDITESWEPVFIKSY